MHSILKKSIATIILASAMLAASPAKAMNLCWGCRSGNVIDCRSGACQSLPEECPSFFESMMCELTRERPEMYW